jgi:hypothetical protein
VPDVYARPEKDATVENFTDALGCPCGSCEVIRQMGPDTPHCSLALIPERQAQEYIAPTEGRRKDKRTLRNEARRARNQRRFLLTVSAT